KINESPTRHWSGKSHELSGLIRVDGRNYIFLGSLPAGIDPGEVLQAQQTRVQITATQTIYNLVCGGVEVVLSFISPLLINDLDLLSRPVTYISIKTISQDLKDHEVQVYFGASAHIATNEEEQIVNAEGLSTSTLNYLKAGTKDQPVLEKKGDDLRIDWGYMYVAAAHELNPVQTISTSFEERDPFATRPGEPEISVGTGLTL